MDKKIERNQMDLHEDYNRKDEEKEEKGTDKELAGLQKGQQKLRYTFLFNRPGRATLESHEYFWVFRSHR